jgi:endonuclease/exonuclease/phosphatase family metal-dependent hydrolase
MRYEDYSKKTVEDVVRLRRRMDASQIPPRKTDQNLILGTWNIQAFGGLHHAWTENPGSPKRNYRGLAIIAEVVRRFDIVAIQELTRETTALRFLLEGFLGEHWGVLMTDVSTGVGGDHERLAYIYDRRRVTPSGLAGEIVLAPTAAGDPREQFDRTPYIVGFRAGAERFALLTAHIKFGDVPEDRIPELRKIAEFTATEIRDRAKGEGAEEANLIVLGDFNIDKRQGNPLFDAFISHGLWVPQELWGLKTTYGNEPKFYDQIAWFRDDLDLVTEGRAGVVDFVGAVFKELTRRSMTFRVSDHFPLWIEFQTDRSEEALGRTLGVDPNMPDPFSSVPD